MTEIEILTMQELAKKFDVTTKTIQRWVARGCPCKTPPGLKRTKVFRYDLVKEWLYSGDDVDPTERARMPQDQTKDTGQGDDIPTGVYLHSKGSNIYWIAYQVPTDGGKTRRVRESSQSCDIQEAAAIRRDRIKAAWKDAPHSTARSKHLREAED